MFSAKLMHLNARKHDPDPIFHMDSSNYGCLFDENGRTDQVKTLCGNSHDPSEGLRPFFYIFQILCRPINCNRSLTFLSIKFHEKLGLIGSAVLTFIVCSQIYLSFYIHI